MEMIPHTKKKEKKNSKKNYSTFSKCIHTPNKTTYIFNEKKNIKPKNLYRNVYFIIKLIINIVILYYY